MTKQNAHNMYMKPGVPSI